MFGRVFGAQRRPRPFFFFSIGVPMIKNENVEGEPAYDETYRRGPVVMRGP